MKTSWILRLVVGFGLGLGWLGTPVRAQDAAPSAREQQLEELVRRLIDRVEQLERRVDVLQDGATRGDVDADGDAGAKIRQLETTVEELKQNQPTPEQWAAVQKWATDPLTLRPFWKDGLRFENLDKSISLKIGGRIQQDYAFFEEDGRIRKTFGEAFADGAEFRRARFYFAGTIYGNIEFKAQYDFAGGDADFKDVYVGLTKLGNWGGFRVGQFKEPFSLEQLTSSNHITFLERSLADAFAPGRSTGIMWHRRFLNDRVTGAFGVFRNTDSFGDGQSDQEFSFTGRVTALAWYEDGGKKLLHVGVAYTHQEYKDEVRFRARPEAHLAPRLVDTGTFSADSGDIVGAELAYVNGPLSLQAEFVQAFIDGSDIPVRNSQFWGGYVMVSYFLTGESRPYKTSIGAFGNVKPLENYSQDGGSGAWEVAARYSRLHLNDGWIRGGRLEDVSLGLNWYLNPNVRVMWNYVLANPSRGGLVNIFETRIQIAF